MISPSLWMIVGYLLAAPFSAALQSCMLHRGYGELKKKQIVIACILGLCLAWSVIKGLDAILGMFPLAYPILCFALWCSSYFAMDCVRKKSVNELDVWDAAWAVCCYFGCLLFVFFMVPALRWCEGCMEYH